MTVPTVKICGLTRREDAELVARMGVRYGGVILTSTGKRAVSPTAAAALFAGLSLERVGVFVDAAPDRLRRDADEAGLDVLQLHGDESPAEVGRLRREGRWRIWKALRLRAGAELVDAIGSYGEVVDALLLDGWSAAAFGGTGTRFPWEEVAPYRDRMPDRLSLVVAGGLNPANVARAIELLRPETVDVSSGVETSPGVKNPDAVPAFLAAVDGSAPRY